MNSRLKRTYSLLFMICSGEIGWACLTQPDCNDAVNNSECDIINMECICSYGFMSAENNTQCVPRKSEQLCVCVELKT